MNCPQCDRADQTEPLVQVTQTVVAWICHRCGVTWNVTTALGVFVPTHSMVDNAQKEGEAR